jgi:alanyl-tRNA synthetase
VTTTERLYYADAYLAEFEAAVVERSSDGLRVYLDRTAFYPTSGGQRHDLGSLGGVRLVDVIDEDDRIAHVLETPPPSDRVTGVVDWPRRFDHMQQHTAQHLLSAIFADRFGWDTASVHFGPDYATIDLATAAVPGSRLREAERHANALVTENRPVKVAFEDAAAATGLRKPTDRQGTLRVVSIEGLDRSACGGTHLRATGEIGAILLGGQEKMKKTTRIVFLAGARAIDRARSDHDALAGIALALSASPAELPSLVSAQAEQLRTLTSARKKVEEELAGFRAREQYAAATPNADGIRILVNLRQRGSAEDARALALAVAGLPGAVFVALCVEPRAVLVAASEDSGVDAGSLLKTKLSAVGGRGGGSARLAQGSVPTDDGFHALRRSMEEWSR